MVYELIVEAVNTNKKLFALLIDPDKLELDHLSELIQVANSSKVSLILLGGSLVNSDVPLYISTLKQFTTIPIVLFPGNAIQFSGSADAIFLLSLISGRNPDFLIGNHMLVSGAIKKSKIEVIPTGYILIDGGTPTSVQYMSNTMPIPSAKLDIAVATALAGEQLGLKLIYLEAGSGAMIPVSSEMISAVKKEISVPLIVGGGLRTPDQVKAAWNAGADLVVVGNALENDINSLPGLVQQY